MLFDFYLLECVLGCEPSLFAAIHTVVAVVYLRKNANTDNMLLSFVHTEQDVAVQNARGLLQRTNVK